MKVYLRTPLQGNEYKICNEITDEVIAIFYKRDLAIKYVESFNKYPLLLKNI